MAEKKPRYLEVIDYIRSEMEKVALKQGDRMPSEKELCDRFGLSRQTIRHATGLLEEEGVITRVRGSGSYIGEMAAEEDRPRFMNVAVMLTYLDNYIFPKVVWGISNTLSQAGYSMQLNVTDNSVKQEEEILQNLLSNQNTADTANRNDNSPEDQVFKMGNRSRKHVPDDKCDNNR